MNQIYKSMIYTLEFLIQPVCQQIIKKKEHIQKLSEYETKRKIRLSETILIILDISNYWEKKNRQIINSVIKESRATILVINKIDTIKKFSEQYIKEQISLLLPQTKEMPTFLFRQKKNRD